MVDLHMIKIYQEIKKQISRDKEVKKISDDLSEKLKGIEKFSNVKVFEVIDSSDTDVNIIVNFSEIRFDRLSTACEKDLQMILDIFDFLDAANKDIGFAVHIVYKNFKQQMDIMYDFYDNYKIIKINARRRNEIYSYLESLSIYYSDYYNIIHRETPILVTDRGINYLEYKSQNSYHINSDIAARVYNASFREIFKLYELTGKKLFKYNVRNGLSGTTSKRLKTAFKSYLYAELISKIDQSIIGKTYGEVVSQLNEIKEVVLSDSQLTELEIKNLATVDFWFKHNGIALYTTSDVSYEYEKIKIDLENSSVINGAQTISNVYLNIFQLRRDITTLISNMDLPPQIDVFLNEIFQKYFDEIITHNSVKLVIIKGREQYTKEVTSGLNTQIPVKDEDIVSIGEYVKKLNELLNNENIKILKAGETYIGTGLSVAEFVKAQKTIEGKPGSARNLSQNEIDEILKDTVAKTNNRKDLNEIIVGTKVFTLLQRWWKTKDNYKIPTSESETAEMQEKNEDIEKAINKYAILMFTSLFIHYVKKELIDISEIEDEDIQLYFNQFAARMFEYGDGIIDYNKYKSDGLYGDIFPETVNDSNSENLPVVNLQSGDQEPKSSELEEVSDIIIEKVITLYNKKRLESKAKSLFSYSVKRVLEEEKCDIVNVRTVSIREGRIKEHYPLNSATFNEFLEVEGYPDYYLEEKENHGIVLSFDASVLKAEIELNYHIFFGTFNGDGELISLLTKRINFSKESDHLIEEANKAFNATLSAFQYGVVKGFPTSGEFKLVHVRPKAQNSLDTFRFTNGENVVKQTFWIGKEVLEDVYKKYNK